MTARRLTSKNGPRLDDQLKHELEGEQTVVESERENELEGVEEVPTDAVAERRELSRHVRSSVFPADRQKLLAEAQANGAPDDVIDLLARLPRGRFGTVHEVWAAVGGESEPIPRGREDRYDEHHRRSSS
jgi:hypothetical protein